LAGALLAAFSSSESPLPLQNPLFISISSIDMVGLNTMADIQNIPDFSAQLAGFRASDEAREQLVAVHVLIPNLPLQSVDHYHRVSSKDMKIY
jgi:hypothetical protein